MIYYFAHAGAEHGSEAESVWHVLQTSWPQIVAVTAVFALIVLGIVHLATKKSSSTANNKIVTPTKDSTSEEE